MKDDKRAERMDALMAESMADVKAGMLAALKVGEKADWKVDWKVASMGHSMASLWDAKKVVLMVKPLVWKMAVAMAAEMVG